MPRLEHAVEIGIGGEDLRHGESPVAGDAVEGVAALCLVVAGRDGACCDACCRTLSDGHEDGLRPDEPAVPEMELIVAFQTFEADAKAFGQRCGPFAALYGVGLPAVPVARFQIALEGVGLAGRNQQIDRRIRSNELAGEGGIEGEEFLAARAGQPRG